MSGEVMIAGTAVSDAWMLCLRADVFRDSLGRSTQAYQAVHSNLSNLHWVWQIHQWKSSKMQGKQTN